MSELRSELQATKCERGPMAFSQQTTRKMLINKVFLKVVQILRFEELGSQLYRS